MTRWGRAAAAVLTAVTIGGAAAGCGGESEAEVLCGKLDQGVLPATALSEMPGADDNMEAAREVLRRAVGQIRATCPQHEGLAQGLEFVLNPVLPPVPPLPEPLPAPVAATPPTTTSARPTTTKQSPVDDRCTNQIDYTEDSRSNAEINSIGAETGTCPKVQRSGAGGGYADPCDRSGTCGADGEGEPDAGYMPDTGTYNESGTSGEAQFEYGCAQGYITEGC